MKLINTKYLICTLILTSVITAPVMANIPQANEAVVILGLPSSNAVLDGDYDKAIKLASSKTSLNNTAHKRAAENISLCVALLKSGQLDSAKEACEKAKQLATSSKNNAGTGVSYYTKPRKFRELLIMASEQNLALISAYQ